MKPLNQTSNPYTYQQRKNDPKFIIKCVLGIILIVSGLFSILFFNSYISGLLRIIAGVLLIPTMLKFIEQLFKITIERIYKYVIIILLFQTSVVISIYQIVRNNHYRNKQSDINLQTEDSDATKNDSSSKALNIGSESDSDGIPTDSLKKLAEEEKPLVEAQKHQEVRLDEFQEKYISGWDGSFRPLVQYVKTNMNDPDSFEHIETNFWAHKDYVLVAMKFQGDNAFGGKAVNVIKAKVSWNGQLIDILKDDD